MHLGHRLFSAGIELVVMALLVWRDIRGCSGRIKRRSTMPVSISNLIVGCARRFPSGRASTLQSSYSGPVPRSGMTHHPMPVTMVIGS